MITESWDLVPVVCIIRTYLSLLVSQDVFYLVVLCCHFSYKCLEGFVSQNLCSLMAAMI